SHGLVLRRDRRKARPRNARLHARPFRAGCPACLEGSGCVRARAHGAGGLLLGRTGDANFRHWGPADTSTLALVAAVDAAALLAPRSTSVVRLQIVRDRLG